MSMLFGCASSPEQAAQPLSVPLMPPPADAGEFSRRGADVEFRLIPPVFEAVRTSDRIDPPDVDNPLRRNNAPYPKGVGAAVPDFVGPFDPGHDERFRANSSAEKNAPSLVFDSLNFDDNGTLGGSLFIPADIHTAVGPDHVINVTNVSLRIHNKSNGAAVSSISLRNFFTAPGFTAPVNATFDPKVLYDTFANRWLVVTLEKTNTDSALFIAVSAGANPTTGTWTLIRVPAVQNIGGNNCWFDYPGFAVDEEAVYLTGNYFRLDNNANCGESRLFIISKSFYSGAAAVVNAFYPVPPGGFNVTHQPAEVYGNAPAGVGTWLVGYSGLSSGGNASVQIVRVDNPLATPTLNLQSVSLGLALQANSGTAPQSGTATGLATNDRRTLSAVWRNDRLYFSFAARPPASAADQAENTAWWAQVNTATPSALALADVGGIGGDSITANAHTFFPAVAVNSAGDMAVGFSVVGPGIFPTSAYTWRAASDPAGTTRTPQILRSGTDFYVRTFSGSANRWGDYSGASVDNTGCFWISNKHAIARGTPSGGDGRWQTATATFCTGWNGFANGFEQ